MTLPSLATFSTAVELSGTITPPEYIVGGFLERRAFAMLFGEPNAGKSFVALDWACCVASGHPWLRRPVQKGIVVYVAGEGRSGIKRRVRAWSQHNGVPLDAIDLYISDYGENFLDPEAMKETMDELRSATSQIALIVVDTMQRVTPGMNEDRAQEVGAFVQACDDLRDVFGATVLVLHHSPHKDKNRAKGSIALKGAVDFEVGLKRTSKSDVVKLICTKVKDGEPPPDMFLRFQSVELPTEGGERVTSAVLTECEAPTEGASAKHRKEKLSPNDRLFLLALGSDAKDEPTVRAAFLAQHPKDRGDAAVNYRRARSRALRRGWFVEEGDKLMPNPAAMVTDNNGQ